MFGHLTYDARADVSGLHRRHHEHGLEALRHVPIHERHLKLVLEIADSAETADVERGADFFCEVDEQSLELRYFDAFVVGGSGANEIDALLSGEESLLGRIHSDRNHEVVDEFAAAIDQVLMPASDGVEAASIDGCGRHVTPRCGRR